MAKELQIDLREGFNGENLLIYVDNMQVYNKPTGTNRLTGFAAEVKTPVDKEEVEIKVEMPDQKISKTEKLNMTNGSFVGISFSGNVLEFKQQAKPFGYD